jgi:lipoprotein NlpI
MRGIMYLNIYKKIWHDIDTIHSLQDQDNSISQRVIELVDRLQTIKPKRKIDLSELHTILGYLGYHFNCYLYDKINIIQQLNQAIKYKPDNAIAWLYIGYYYFDNHKWQCALDAFNSIDQNSFDTFIVTLKLKIIELKLCCKIRLNKSHLLPDEFYQFLNKLTNTEFDYKSYPLELQKTIQESDLDSDIQNKALNLIRNNEN